MARLAASILELSASGRQHFTTDQAVTALGTSVTATRAALRRLKARGDIADPFRGFHVIVPPEYRRLGCLPASQFVPQLMLHLGERYYVALLSAAELHGAGHQRPQSFQVMVKRNRRAIVCGEVDVQFVARQDMETTPTVERKTPRGMLHVSTSEATMLELVGYADRCGGLDNVASVLEELVESVDPGRLLTECHRSPVAWVQRLGYLLDLIGQRGLAEALAGFVTEHVTTRAPLVRSATLKGARRDKRWKLAVNAVVEPEL